jgi:hypothetical protein
MAGRLSFRFIRPGADLDEVAGEDAVPARGSGHTAYAELVQVAVDGCEALAAVGGNCPWWAPGSADDPFNCRCQLRCIMGISELDVMVEDDAVGVVSNRGR